MIGALPWLPLDGALFLLFVPASVASLALAYLIARHLVGDRLSAVLFLALYVAGFRLLTVGSPILHSAELTPAFLALPLQLGALYAFLRERHALDRDRGRPRRRGPRADQLVRRARDRAGVPDPASATTASATSRWPAA